MATTSFIGHGYFIEQAVLTTGNEVAGTLATNLQNMQPSKRWHTSGTSNVWVQVDLNSAMACDFAAIVSHNGSASDTWLIQASSDGTPATSPDYSSGSQNLFPSAVKPTWPASRLYWDTHYVFASTQTWRYWRFTFTVASAFKAGVLILGLRNQLQITTPFSRGHMPADVVERSPQGGQSTEVRGRPRAWSFEVNMYDEAGEMLADRLDAERGIGQGVFCVDDTAATTYMHRKSMYGLLANPTSIDKPQYNLRKKRYDILELI